MDTVIALPAGHGSHEETPTGQNGDLETYQFWRCSLTFGPCVNVALTETDACKTLAGVKYP